MYHRQVSSRPSAVFAVRSASDAPASAPAPDEASRIRLSTIGVSGAPAAFAVCRVATSEVSTPSRIQSVGPSSRPLSKTDSKAFEEYAVANGAHSSPAADGSLRSETLIGAEPVTSSPNFTPPPVLLNTERPSLASRSEADQ